MSDLPILTIRDVRKRRTHVEGFNYFWLKYVLGFDPAHHCAQCLIGPYDDRFGGEVRYGSQRTLVDTPMVLDRSPFECIYLCGNSGVWRLNLHVAFIHKPGESFMVPTFNGYQVIVENGVRLPIPPLRDKWRGLPKAFTTCRNFQFAVAFFGPEGSR